MNEERTLNEHKILALRLRRNNAKKFNAIKCKGTGEPVIFVEDCAPNFETDFQVVTVEGFNFAISQN